MGCASTKAGDQVVTQVESVVAGHDRNDIASPNPENADPAGGCSLGDVRLEEVDVGHRIEPERDALEDSLQSKQEYHSWSGDSDRDAALKGHAQANAQAKHKQQLDKYMGKIAQQPKQFVSDVKTRRKVTHSDALKACIRQAHKQPHVFVDKLHHPSAKEDSDSSLSLSQ
eukprot:TRINITY_DN41229_c0_g1_i1.p1 TRINITY_DN41229_c0_g1~~TRINITY_DN41229_c0_g1_i1.p1  ORF type:complete len:170 (-),score=32.45 TRINITY_DN41229_c0_g1_i1:186-695(-)